LERLSCRYRIVNARQTLSFFLTGQENIYERQYFCNLLATLSAPSCRIPIAIKEGTSSSSANMLQESEGRLSPQGRQAKVPAEEHKILLEDFRRHHRGSKHLQAPWGGQERSITPRSLESYGDARGLVGHNGHSPIDPNGSEFLQDELPEMITSHAADQMW